VTAVRALVLARGRGQRMREGHAGAALSDDQHHAASLGWKALMPVGGRPFLDYVLSTLADAGCLEVGVVIGAEQREAFQPFAREGRTTRTRVTLIEQPAPRGTADAVVAAASWVGDDPFLVVNGDNLYPATALRGLVEVDGPALVVFDRDALVASSNIPAARVADFAIADVTADGELRSIREKPAGAVVTDSAGHVWVSMNAWRFDRRLLDACQDVELSPRGEYELPAAVELAMSRGVRLRTVASSGPVLDLSRPGDVGDVTRRLSGVEARP
jgi:dTDP-glucose pyrophosphorylase